MAEDWRQQPERSSRLMLSIIVFMATHLRRSVVRPILYPIVAYFLLTGGRARAASADYLRRVLGRKATWRDQWRHFFTFASCILDRIFLLSKNHAQIRVDAVWSPGIEPLVSSGRGCLLIAAHFGSPDALRLTPPPQPDRLQLENVVHAAAKPLHTTLLLDRRVGRMLIEMVERLNPELAMTVIDASERGPQLALKLKESLEAGHMVCLTGDRVAPEESFSVVNFLGGRAKFSTAPWLMAGALRVPVILGFGVYEGGNRFTSHFELFAEQLSLPRANRQQLLDECAQRYATRVEHYVRMAPYNWANFYDYWLSDHDAHAESHETPAH
jgi:predicted LPLAT superfamily acyltransferase